MTEFSKPANPFWQEFDQNKSLFEYQPIISQRLIESQAQQITNALINKAFQFHFSLPDRVTISVIQVGQNVAVTIPEDQHPQCLGGFKGGSMAEFKMLETAFNNPDKF